MSRRKRTAIALVAAGACLGFLPPAAAKEYSYTLNEKLALMRELTAEFATAKLGIPRAKKPLPVDPSGKIDAAVWTDAQEEHGPAARMGDAVQITKVTLERKRIVFELNGGFKGGRKWWERVQIGVGTSTTPVGGRPQMTAQPVGTQIALVFADGVPELRAFEIKEMLNPVLDFEKRTATEQYVDTLPEPVQAAIREKRAIEGMDQDAVLVSLGRPVRKIRETRDGVELEDWVYGEPPGKMTFVTFEGRKVVRVKEVYAGLGGTVAPPLPAQ